MDELLDQNLRNRFLDHVGNQARKVRSGEEGGLNWPLTGFLLRSDLVEGWQGLEMKASGVDRQGNRIDPLLALRIDRLSPEIMLCLFNGKVTEIEIKQPPEGLHFGAEHDPGNKKYCKGTLRKLAPADKTGDQIAKQFNIEVPMRQGSKRVVDVEKLASQMMEKLTSEIAIEGPDFTSAKFAVQMVESPGKATFRAPEGKAK
jgi:hypothetical protein